MDSNKSTRASKLAPTSFTAWSKKVSQEYVDANDVRNLHRAGFRTQQILHLRVKMSIGCVSGGRDGNEGIWTH